MLGHKARISPDFPLNMLHKCKVTDKTQHVTGPTVSALAFGEQFSGLTSFHPNGLVKLGEQFAGLTTLHPSGVVSGI